jgi:hypothetical protein
MYEGIIQGLHDEIIHYASHNNAFDGCLRMTADGMTRLADIEAENREYEIQNQRIAAEATR